MCVRNQDKDQNTFIRGAKPCAAAPDPAGWWPPLSCFLRYEALIPRQPEGSQGRRVGWRPLTQRGFSSSDCLLSPTMGAITPSSFENFLPSFFCFKRAAELLCLIKSYQAHVGPRLMGTQALRLPHGPSTLMVPAQFGFSPWRL